MSRNKKRIFALILSLIMTIDCFPIYGQEVSVSVSDSTVSSSDSSSSDSSSSDSSSSDSSSSDSSSSDSSSSDSSSSDSSSSDSSSNDSSSSDSSSNDSSSNDSSSSDSSSNDSSSNDSSSNDSSSNDSSSNDSESNDSSSNDVASDDSSSNDSESNDSSSNDSESNDSSSDDSESNDSSSNDSENNDSSSNDSENNDSSSNDSENNDSSSNDSESNDSSSNDSENNDSSSDDSESNDSSSNDSENNDSSSDDSESNDSSSNDAASDDDTIIAPPVFDTNGYNAGIFSLEKEGEETEEPDENAFDLVIKNGDEELSDGDTIEIYYRSEEQKSVTLTAEYNPNNYFKWIIDDVSSWANSQTRNSITFTANANGGEGDLKVLMQNATETKELTFHVIAYVPKVTVESDKFDENKNLILNVNSKDDKETATVTADFEGVLGNEAEYTIGWDIPTSKAFEAEADDKTLTVKALKPGTSRIRAILYKDGEKTTTLVNIPVTVKFSDSYVAAQSVKVLKGKDNISSTAQKLYNGSPDADTYPSSMDITVQALSSDGTLATEYDNIYYTEDGLEDIVITAGASTAAEGDEDSEDTSSSSNGVTYTASIKEGSTAMSGQKTVTFYALNSDEEYNSATSYPRVSVTFQITSGMVAAQKISVEQDSDIDTKDGTNTATLSAVLTPENINVPYTVTWISSEDKVDAANRVLTYAAKANASNPATVEEAGDTPTITTDVIGDEITLTAQKAGKVTFTATLTVKKDDLIAAGISAAGDRIVKATKVVTVREDLSVLESVVLYKVEETKDEEGNVTGTEITSSAAPVTNTIYFDSEDATKNVIKFGVKTTPTDFKGTLTSTDSNTIMTVAEESGIYTFTAQRTGTFAFTIGANGVTKTYTFNVIDKDSTPIKTIRIFSQETGLEVTGTIVTANAFTVDEDNKATPTKITLTDDYYIVAYDASGNEIDEAYEDVTWKVDNSAVGSIDATGTLTLGGSAGQLKVTAMANDGNGATTSINFKVEADSVTDFELKNGEDDAVGKSFEVYFQSGDTEVPDANKSQTFKVSDITPSHLKEPMKVTSSNSSVVVETSTEEGKEYEFTVKCADNITSPVTATITVTVGAISKTFTVKALAYNTTLTAIDIQDKDTEETLASTLYYETAGTDTVTVKANPTPSIATIGDTLEWSSSNKTIIKISSGSKEVTESGNVQTLSGLGASDEVTLTLMKAGSANITLKDTATGKSKVVKVTVKDKNIPVSSVNVTKNGTAVSNISLTQKPSTQLADFTLGASITPADALLDESTPYTWEAEFVDSTGKADTDAIKINSPSEKETTVTIKKDITGSGMITLTVATPTGNIVKQIPVNLKLSTATTNVSSIVILKPDGTTAVSSTEKLSKSDGATTYTVQLKKSTTVLEDSSKFACYSSDETVATVTNESTDSGAGAIEITPLKPGTTTITVAAIDGSGIKKTFNLTVEGVDTTTLTVKKGTDAISDGATIEVDDDFSIVATIDENTDNEITATSSNAKIKVAKDDSSSGNTATFNVTLDGVTDTTATGTITVTAGPKTLKFTVKAIPKSISGTLTGISIAESGTAVESVELSSDDSTGKTLSVLANPATASIPDGATYEWTLSGSSSITLDNADGDNKVTTATATVKATDYGTATLTVKVTAGDNEFTSTVKVNCTDSRKPITSVILNADLKTGTDESGDVKTTTSVGGKTIQIDKIPSDGNLDLSAVVNPADADGLNYKWETSGIEILSLPQALTGNTIQVSKNGSDFKNGVQTITLTVSDYTGKEQKLSVQISNIDANGTKATAIKLFNPEDATQEATSYKTTLVKDGTITLPVLLVGSPDIGDFSVTSSNTDVLTVGTITAQAANSDTAGNVVLKMVGEGTTTITVKSLDGSNRTKTISITLLPVSAELQVKDAAGKEVSSVTVYNYKTTETEDATNAPKTVDLTVDIPNIATVTTKDGLTITPKGDIKVSTDGSKWAAEGTDTATIAIEDITADGVSFPITLKVSTKDGINKDSTGSITIKVGDTTKNISVSTKRYSTTVKDFNITDATDTTNTVLTNASLYLEKSGDAYVAPTDTSKKNTMTAKLTTDPIFAKFKFAITWEVVSGNDVVSIVPSAADADNGLKGGETCTITATKPGNAKVSVKSVVDGKELVRTLDIAVKDVNINATKVTIKKDNASISGKVIEMEKGANTIDLTSEITPSDAKVTYSWASDNTSLATVSGTTSATTVTVLDAYGTATITLTATNPDGSTVKDSFKVNVKDANANLVKTVAVQEEKDSKWVDVKTATIQADGTGRDYRVQLTATDTETNLSNANVSIQSSDENIVTASVKNVPATNTGIGEITITPVKVGNATITVTAQDGSLASTTVNIVVQPVLASSLTLSVDSAKSKKLKETTPYTTPAADAKIDGTKVFSWVDGTEKAEATIRLAGVTPTTIETGATAEIQLTAAVDAAATNQGVKWKTSNPNTASIAIPDADHPEAITVTVKALGTVTLTAQSADGNISKDFVLTIKSSVAIPSGVTFTVKDNDGAEVTDLDKLVLGSDANPLPKYTFEPTFTSVEELSDAEADGEGGKIDKSLMFKLLSNSKYGDYSVDSNGVYTVTPKKNAEGTYQFQIKSKYATTETEAALSATYSILMELQNTPIQSFTLIDEKTLEIPASKTLAYKNANPNYPQEFKFKISATPSNYTDGDNYVINAVSNDAEVVTVSGPDADGYYTVTAVGSGKGEITVSFDAKDGVTAPATLTAKKINILSTDPDRKPIDHIDLIVDGALATSANITAGTTSAVRAKAIDKDGNEIPELTFEWALDNETDLQLTTNDTRVSAQVKALSTTTQAATLTVKALDGSDKTATLTINVTPEIVENITAETTAQIDLNGTFNFIYSTSPTNSNIEDVVWSSSDESIFTVGNITHDTVTTGEGDSATTTNVSNKGYVTLNGVGMGTATLTGKANVTGVTVTAQVTVVNENGAIPTKIEIVKGETVVTSTEVDSAAVDTDGTTLTDKVELTAKANEGGDNTVEWTITEGDDLIGISVASQTDGKDITKLAEVLTVKPLTFGAEGTAKITATSIYDPEVKAEITINVKFKQAYVEKVELTSDVKADASGDINVEVDNETITFTAKVTGQNNGSAGLYTKTVSFTVSDGTTTIDSETDISSGDAKELADALGITDPSTELIGVNTLTLTPTVAGKEITVTASSYDDTVNTPNTVGKDKDGNLVTATPISFNVKKKVPALAALWYLDNDGTTEKPLFTSKGAVDNTNVFYANTEMKIFLKFYEYEDDYINHPTNTTGSDAPIDVLDNFDISAYEQFAGSAAITVNTPTPADGTDGDGNEVLETTATGKMQATGSIRIGDVIGYIKVKNLDPASVTLAVTDKDNAAVSPNGTSGNYDVALTTDDTINADEALTITATFAASGVSDIPAGVDDPTSEEVIWNFGGADNYFDIDYVEDDKNNDTETSKIVTLTPKAYTDIETIPTSSLTITATSKIASGVTANITIDLAPMKPTTVNWTEGENLTQTTANAAGEMVNRNTTTLTVVPGITASDSSFADVIQDKKLSYTFILADGTGAEVSGSNVDDYIDKEISEDTNTITITAKKPTPANNTILITATSNADNAITGTYKITIKNKTIETVRFYLVDPTGETVEDVTDAGLTIYADDFQNQAGAAYNSTKQAVTVKAVVLGDPGAMEWLDRDGTELTGTTITNSGSEAEVGNYTAPGNEITLDIKPLADGTWLKGSDIYTLKYSDATDNTNVKTGSLVVNVENWYTYIKTIDLSDISATTFVAGQQGTYTFPVEVVEGASGDAPQITPRMSGDNIHDGQICVTDSIRLVDNITPKPTLASIIKVDEVEINEEGTQATFTLEYNDGVDLSSATTVAIGDLWNHIFYYNEAGEQGYTLSKASAATAVSGDAVLQIPLSYVEVPTDLIICDNVDMDSVVASLDGTSNTQVLTLGKPGGTYLKSKKLYFDEPSGLIWSSSDYGVVKINGSTEDVTLYDITKPVTIEGVAAGTATITVTSELDSNVKVEFTVKVVTYEESQYIAAYVDDDKLVDDSTDNTRTETTEVEINLFDENNQPTTDTVTLKAKSYSDTSGADDKEVTKSYTWQIMSGNVTFNDGNSDVDMIEDDGTGSGVELIINGEGTAQIIVEDDDAVSKVINLKFKQQEIYPTSVTLENTDGTSITPWSWEDTVDNGAIAPKTYNVKLEPTTINVTELSVESTNEDVATVELGEDINGKPTITITYVDLGETDIIVKAKGASTEATADDYSVMNLLPVKFTSAKPSRIEISSDVKTIYYDDTTSVATITYNVYDGQGELITDESSVGLTWTVNDTLLDLTDAPTSVGAEPTKFTVKGNGKLGKATLTLEVTDYKGNTLTESIDINVKANQRKVSKIDFGAIPSVNCKNGLSNLIDYIDFFGMIDGETDETLMEATDTMKGSVAFSEVADINGTALEAGEGLFTFDDNSENITGIKAGIIHSGNGFIKAVYTDDNGDEFECVVEISIKCTCVKPTQMTVDPSSIEVYDDGPNKTKDVRIRLGSSSGTAVNTDLLVTVVDDDIASAAKNTTVTPTNNQVTWTITGLKEGSTVIKIVSLADPNFTKIVPVYVKTTKVVAEGLQVFVNEPDDFEEDDYILLVPNSSGSPDTSDSNAFEIEASPYNMRNPQEFTYENLPIEWTTESPDISIQKADGTAVTPTRDGSLYVFDTGSYLGRVVVSNSASSSGYTNGENPVTISARVKDTPEINADDAPIDILLRGDKLPVTGIKTNVGLTRQTIEINKEVSLEGDLGIEVTLTPNNHSVKGYNVTSENTSVVQVVQNDSTAGDVVIKGLKAGNAVLTIKSNSTVGPNSPQADATTTLNITVVNPPVPDTTKLQYVSGGKATNQAGGRVLNMALGSADTAEAEVKLQLIVPGSDGLDLPNDDPIITGNTITWKSEDAGIATVTPDADNPRIATVKAVQANSGQIRITVKIGDVERYVFVVVENGAVKATSMALDSTSGTINYTGSTPSNNASFTAKLTPETGHSPSEISDKTVTATVSDANAIEVSVGTPDATGSTTVDVPITVVMKAGYAPTDGETVYVTVKDAYNHSLKYRITFVQERVYADSVTYADSEGNDTITFDMADGNFKFDPDNLTFTNSNGGTVTEKTITLIPADTYYFEMVVDDTTGDLTALKPKNEGTTALRVLYNTDKSTTGELRIPVTVTVTVDASAGITAASGVTADANGYIPVNFSRTKNKTLANAVMLFDNIKFGALTGTALNGKFSFEFVDANGNSITAPAAKYMTINANYGCIYASSPKSAGTVYYIKATLIEDTSKTITFKITTVA